MDIINQFTKLCVSDNVENSRVKRKAYLEDVRRKRLLKASLCRKAYLDEARRKRLVKASLCRKAYLDEARRKRLIKASLCRKEYLIKCNKRLEKELDLKKKELGVLKEIIEMDKKRVLDKEKKNEMSRNQRIKSHYILFGLV